MSLARALGSAMMRAAQVLAPPQRADWVRGMRAEFDMLENDGAALSWAGGCMGTALGLRMRSEAGYVLVMTAVLVLWRPLVKPYAWMLANALWSGNIFMFERVIEGVCLALLSFALCLYRPGRMLLTVVLISLFEWGTLLFVWMFAHREALILPEFWTHLGWRISEARWPIIPGALAAWGYVRFVRRRGRLAG